MPLTVNLRVVNAAGSCADLVGYAVYLWHCDREGQGRYSMYSIGVAAENYPRGVQSTDSSGTATFTGLGLHTARDLLLRQGGQQHLSNRPEGGLRAEVRLTPQHATASSR